MLKLLIWKLPSAWVSFVIFFLHTPSTQRSHNDRLSHCCHLPQACSPNVNTIFYGAVTKIPSRSLLTIQDRPWNVFGGHRDLPPTPIAPVAQWSCHRSFWLRRSFPLPIAISYCLNINGKPFKFMGRRELLLTRSQQNDVHTWWNYTQVMESYQKQKYVHDIRDVSSLKDQYIENPVLFYGSYFKISCSSQLLKPHFEKGYPELKHYIFSVFPIHHRSRVLVVNSCHM